jgi:hypothetical protein
MRHTLGILLVLLGLTIAAASQNRPNTNTVERYGIYELSVTQEGLYSNPWEDVVLTAQFAGPGGKRYAVRGFYYGKDQWKVRFNPPAAGVWIWSYRLTSPGGARTGSGAVSVIDSARPGFLRIRSSNPYRLVFDNGSLFNGIGINDCLVDVDQSGSPLDNWGFDGGFRQPGSPDYGRIVDMQTYLTAYGKSGAGFNLYRWSVDNCSFKLWNTISTVGNRYLVREGIWGDQLVQALRDHGLRIWMTIFGFNPAYPDATGSSAKQVAVNKYIDYVVARYGAYVDLWELMNEATVPHWYEKESEFESDQVCAHRILAEKQWNKPVLFGEQGNTGQNWDPKSGLRMRLRTWAAFFNEGTLVFWNSSFAKDFRSDGAANIYLGPAERRMIRILQNFTSGLPADIKPFLPSPGNPGVRAYGLNSGSTLLLYLHHFANHSSSVTITISLSLPARSALTWIDPANGRITGNETVDAGVRTVQSPSFSIDLALKTTPIP